MHIVHTHTILTSLTSFGMACALRLPSSAALAEVVMASALYVPDPSTSIMSWTVGVGSVQLEYSWGSVGGQNRAIGGSPPGKPRFHSFRSQGAVPPAAWQSTVKWHELSRANGLCLRYGLSCDLGLVFKVLCDDVRQAWVSEAVQGCLGGGYAHQRAAGMSVARSEARPHVPEAG